MAIKKKTLLIAFLSSPQGQKILKDAAKKLDTPKNREKFNEFSRQFKEKATQAKDKHSPKLQEVADKMKAKKKKVEKTEETSAPIDPSI